MTSLKVSTRRILLLLLLLVLALTTQGTVEANVIPRKYDGLALLVQQRHARRRNLALGRTTANNDYKSSQGNALYLLRGGGSMQVWQKPFVKAFHLVSGSKSACWTVLVSSILLEGVATSLSKSARDKGSAMRLLGALLVYIPWYVIENVIL